MITAEKAEPVKVRALPFQAIAVGELFCSIESTENVWLRIVGGAVCLWDDRFKCSGKLKLVTCDTTCVLQDCVTSDKIITIQNAEF